MYTKIKIRLQILWKWSLTAVRRNAGTIAVTVCGVLMGILFASRIATFEAQRFQAVLQSSTPLPVSLPSSPSQAASSASDTNYTEQSSSASLHPAPVAEGPEQGRREEPQSRLPTAPGGADSSVSSSSSESSLETESLPPFLHASFPVSRVPNWGAMRTPLEWNRTYSELQPEDFVPIPRYDLSMLTIPMETLTNPMKNENIPIITAKLFYSTRFFGTYDLDSGELTGTHPGIDLKLALGTPIGSIAGGRVSSVEQDATLGLHVTIEHRLKSGETFHSIYGHLGTAAISAGETVVPGQTVGTVGMTGKTTAPHLHLQIDRGVAGDDHREPYLPTSANSQSEALAHVVHPISFIAKYRNGE